MKQTERPPVAGMAVGPPQLWVPQKLETSGTCSSYRGLSCGPSATYWTATGGPGSCHGVSYRAKPGALISSVPVVPRWFCALGRARCHLGP